jgi:uncharacterized short protein YbdD (DUF466 family)
MSRLANWSRAAWSVVRAVTGDDAYERYLAHRRRRHPGQETLDREAFHRAELERRWKGVSRCC